MNNPKISKTAVRASVAVLLLMLFITALAYLDLVPKVVKRVPYHDSLGHFMLFGILCYTVDQAFRSRALKVFGLTLPVAVTLVTLYALVDESFQVLSPNRTFDFHDLGFGLLGVAVFYFLSRLTFKK